MKFNKTLISILALSVCLNLPGCNHKESHEHYDHDSEQHEKHDHEHERHDHSSEKHNAADADKNPDEGHGHDEITFSPEKAKSIGLEIETVAPGVFYGVIPTSGRILPASGAESTVSATIAGEVKLARSFNEGESVTAGTPLFLISTARLPDGDAARQAAVRLNKAESDFARIQSLSEKQLATAADLSAAKAELEAARIAAAGAGKPGGKGIAAPIAGYVRQLLVRDGDFVEVGQPLMIITRDRRLQLRAEVSERDFDRLSSITSAKFRTASGRQTYDMREMNGRVVSYGRSSGEDTPFIPVILEFDNRAGIVPGAYAEVYLLTSEGTDALSVPVSALIEEQGVYSLFIREDEECYRKQVVAIGPTDGERTRILSGLKPGDQVVTRGAINLKLASAANTIPGHTHEH